MKIAFVTQPFDLVGPTRLFGSISIIAYQIARSLASTCDVMIYGKRGREQQVEEIDDLGIHYRRMSVGGEVWLSKPFKLFDRLLPFRNPKRPFFSSDFSHRGYVMQVAMDLRKRNVDIVHVFNYSQFAPVIRSIAPDVKIVLHMQCEWLTQLDQKLIENRLQDIDLVVGCSDFITDKIRLRYPQFANHCRTAYNGVALEDFRKGGNSNHDNDEIILFVGRVSPEKGVHILLDAFRDVLAQRPQARLDIVGSPSVVPFDYVVQVSDDEDVIKLGSFYRGKIRKRDHYGGYLDKQLSSAEWKQVNKVGGVPHQGIVDYYRKADVFAFTSVWDEPFGIPMVEAMACGLPVVAAKGGAVPEIVENGKTGIWVERGNSTELADAILRLLEDDELRKSMGKEGRERASELFTWDLTAAKLLDYYQNLLDD